jgi:uncharacterized membrane protein YfcA
MSDAPGLVDLALFAAGFVSWAISTLAAGGGSVLIVAAVAVILRGQAIAPVVTMTSVLASPARMILLWRFIDWRVVRWYLPGAVPVQIGSTSMHVPAVPYHLQARSTAFQTAGAARP